MSKRKIVISGINLFEGGPLTIYYDMLDMLINMDYDKKYDITCFVHRVSLFEKYRGNFSFIELPRSRSSYLLRMYYEYIYFHRYSRKKDIYAWISLHDMTPNVKAERLFTYCHNPTPFLKPDKKFFRFSKSVFFMSLFYKHLYAINIKKNTAVIVQQKWLRDEFKKMYGIKNVIVAHPSVDVDVVKQERSQSDNNKYKFFFPSFPRAFKNFEIICRAAAVLSKYSDEFEVWLTTDGSENKYSQYLRKTYQSVRSVRWIGLQSRDEMIERYNSCDCVIFPSKLETWGLPIIEAKAYGKPILLADLPYAHETVGSCRETSFFDPDNPKELAKLMLGCIRGTIRFKGNNDVIPDAPYADNWRELIKMIVG
ncbi:MAG: glycosyltransferase [Ruminococcus sp.]|nr:glycosyltransferase [Ruminococcus sp.]